MKLALVLGASPTQLDMPGTRREEIRLVPQDYPPEVANLALLGQDPLASWTGPAPFALAASGQVLAEDETAYLLTPVRVADGRVVDEVDLGPGRIRDLVEALDEALEGEAVQVVPGRPLVLVVGETAVGPPTLAAPDLKGRTLDGLPAGPPALLARVVQASRDVCSEWGRPATHLLPSCPGGPPGVKPLRETWLGLGPSAVVGGERSIGQALATLLSLRTIPPPVGGEVSAALELGDAYDVVVIVPVGRPRDLSPLGEVPALAVAGTPDLEGRVQVAWRGPVEELGGGVDLLKPLALAGL